MNKVINFQNYSKEHPKEPLEGNLGGENVIGMFDSKRNKIMSEIRFELVSMGIPEESIEKIVGSVSYMTKSEARQEALKNLKEFWRQTDEYEGPPDDVG